MIGPSRPTAAPVPIDSAEASDLMTATSPRMLPLFVENGVHHFGDAVPLGLGREALDQVDDDEAAEDRREDDPIAEGAWSFQDVRVIGDAEDAF